MQCFARMKKYSVTNKVDKDGQPEPTVQVALEMDFAEGIVNELAAMTGGKLIILQMDVAQTEMQFSKAGR